MTKRFPARVCVLALSLAFGDVLPGQTIDPAAFTPSEAKQLEQARQLRRRDAIETLLADVRDRCESAATDAAGRRTAAFAEYEILRIVSLAQGLVAPTQVLAWLEPLLDTPLCQAHPFLRDTIALRAMVLHHVRGDGEKRVARRQALGFVQDWWLIGPFDNERGSGYGGNLESIVKFDLDRSYPGKKRDVRWRPLPVPPIRGFVNIGATVRPYRQVFCQLATAVESDRDRDAVLYLGSSEGFEVFLNGKKIFGRDVQRYFAYDQDGVVLPLASGKNLLVVRILTQKGAMTGAMRLRALDGKPLTGVRTSAARGDMVAASKQAARAPGTKDQPFLGARSVFGDGAADAYRLSSVLNFYRPHDHTDRRVQEIVRKAVQGLPDHPAPKYALAATRLQAHRVVADREDNPRRHEYLALLEKHPKDAKTLLALAELELSSTRATARAEPLLRRALQVNAKSPTLHLAHSACLTAARMRELAWHALRRAAAPTEHGDRHVGALRRLARSHLSGGRLKEARAAYDQLLIRSRSAQDRMDLATLLARQGQRDAAVKTLERSIADFPYEVRIVYQLSRLLEAEGNVDAAMRPLMAWLSICPEDDSAHIELARLHGMKGSIDQQREALHTAVTLNPNRKNDRRLLEFLAAEARPFYADYEIDSAAVIKKDRGPTPDVAKANDPYYYVFDQKVVHAYRNGTASEYRHFAVRVLNSEGSRAFATYRVPHYWGEQRGRLLEVKVHKPDGSVQRPRLSGSVARLTGLGKGDVVEVRERVDDYAPGFFGDYFGFEHQFARTRASKLAQLVVVLDKGRQYQLQTRNGAPQPARTQDAKGNAVWTFDMADLARATAEERQPDSAEHRPLARVTTYASWNAFSSWWWNLIKKQSEVSPGIEKKVAELTKGLDSTKAKIDAIYRFVTTEVRYEAWEFGVHGYKPYSTPVIFERRHGDCKDKSLLLNAMLSQIGVTAYPVLIHAEPQRSKDDLSLPMVNHFNHCISFVEKTDETPAMFLDGTASYHPLDTLPEMDHGADVLVVRGPRGDIRTIPWPQAAANRDDLRVDIALAANGDATIDYRLTPTLNSAVWARDYLGNEPAKRKEHLEKILKRDFGALTLESFEVGDLLDLNKPVNIHARLRATKFARRQDRGLVLRADIDTQPLGQLALAEKRTHALILGIPSSTMRELRYTLPAGHTPLSVPKPTRLDTPFARFELAWSHAGDKLTMQRRLFMKVNRIEPADYAAFREFATKVDDATRQVVVLEKKGGER